MAVEVLLAAPPPAQGHRLVPPLLLISKSKFILILAMNAVCILNALHTSIYHLMTKLLSFCVFLVMHLFMC